MLKCSAVFSEVLPFFDMPAENTAETPTTETAVEQPSKPKRLIGSQRNPDAYRPKPTIAVVGDASTSAEPPNTKTYPPEGAKQPPKPVVDDPDDEMPDHLSAEGEKKLKSVPPKPIQAVAVPKYRRDGKMTDDLEAEFSAVFGNDSAAVEAILQKSSEITGDLILETDTKVKAKVLSVQGDSVFFDIGAREQGIVSLRMFPADAEPKQGDEIPITVVRFLKDEGLYEVSVPLAAADVRDWSQLQEGMIVEALITKTNTGGLECEVNRLRGFIPLSQVELYRVEDFEQYVGKKLTCVVEEVNAERRNLVLSRKAMLIREREEKRQQLLAELEVGQTREGLVRKIIDGGAFVDLGGVDGFLPIGELAWGRIRHPSDMLTEGTRINVRITKIEEGSNRITLTYKDEASNPWSNITERFQEKTLARGKVTKAMDFGAFVELMPGVEGLVHISELSNKRVNNVSEVVKEGDWIDVYILGIDTENRKMSLSIKQATVSKTSATEGEDEAEDEAPAKPKNVYKGPLKGGTGQAAGGEKFGLKW
jgi:small subunit ribosomal protein S1